MSYNYDTSRNSKNFTPASQARALYGMDRKIEGITIHWWGNPADNPQFASVRDYLCTNSSQTSAHFVATGTKRQVACIVAPRDVAWHSGSAWGNARTIGIELDPRCRDEDYDVAAELIADIRSAYGDVPIYWHSYFINTVCPGKWNPERLDKLSYTKYSAPVAWGKGGDIKPKAPTKPVTKPTPPPTKALYKLLVGNKQVAAYSTDANAYRGFVLYGSKGKITLSGKDVTASLKTKFTKPSPTTTDDKGTTLPDSGKPVTEKNDYTELLNKVNENNNLLTQLVEWFKKVFNIK